MISESLAQFIIPILITILGFIIGLVINGFLNHIKDKFDKFDRHISATLQRFSGKVDQCVKALNLHAENMGKHKKGVDGSFLEIKKDLLDIQEKFSDQIRDDRRALQAVEQSCEILAGKLQISSSKVDSVEDAVDRLQKIIDMLEKSK